MGAAVTAMTVFQNCWDEASTSIDRQSNYPSSPPSTQQLRKSSPRPLGAVGVSYHSSPKLQHVIVEAIESPPSALPHCTRNVRRPGTLKHLQVCKKQLTVSHQGPSQPDVVAHFLYLSASMACHDICKQRCSNTLVPGRASTLMTPERRSPQTCNLPSQTSNFTHGVLCLSFINTA